MTTCLRQSCSFGLCVWHRRRKVLNIGSGGAEQSSEYWGGGGNFSLAVN